MEWLKRLRREYWLPTPHSSAVFRHDDASSHDDAVVPQAMEGSVEPEHSRSHSPLLLTATMKSNPQTLRATGTFGTADLQLAPLLAPSRANLGQAESLTVTSTTRSECDDQAGTIVAKLDPLTKTPRKKRVLSRRLKGG